MFELAVLYALCKRDPFEFRRLHILCSHLYASPKPSVVVAGSLDIEGLGKVDMEELFSLPRDYWREEIRETRQFLDQQVGIDLPDVIDREVQAQHDRISKM